MLSFINPGDDLQQDPATYQQHARLERDLARLAIEAAFAGRLSRPLILVDSNDPFPVTRQLLGANMAGSVIARPQKGTLEWWQAVREQFVQQAEKLLSYRFVDELQEDDSTGAGPKPNPNNIVKYIPAYLCLLETCIVRFDNFSRDPNQNEIALRNDLVARYILVANRVIKDLVKHLDNREFDIAHSKVTKIYDLYDQNEESKLRNLILFENAKEVHYELGLIKGTLEVFNTSRIRTTNKLASDIVKNALGNESLYWGQNLVPVLTSILNKCWHKLYTDRPDLIENLLNTTWCQTMIALIRSDLATIGYPRWIGLGFCYGNTKELKHAMNMESVLTRMILDVPNSRFEYITYARSMHDDDEENQPIPQPNIPDYPDLLAWSRLLENWGIINQQELEADVAALDVAASTVATQSRPGVYLG